MNWSNESIGFGYLSLEDQIHHSSLLDKAKRLTELSVNIHFPKVNNKTAKTVDALLEWFNNQPLMQFLIVIKHGVILASGQIIRNSMVDLITESASVKGSLHFSQGVWHLGDDLIIFAKTYQVPVISWGMPNILESFHACKLVSMNAKFILVKDKHDVNLTTTACSGWKIINDSIKANVPVININDVEMLNIYNMQPAVNQNQLLVQLATGNSKFSYQPQTISPQQRTFIQKYGKNSQMGIDIFGSLDFEPMLEVLPTKIKRIYGTTDGFRTLMILKHHGFGSDTQVMHFNQNLESIMARKLLISEWDGMDLPVFMNAMEKEKGFRFQQTWDEIHDYWSRLLSRLSGPREFKSLWDQYQKLTHIYRTACVIESPDLAIQNFNPDPHSYIWWGHSFCKINTHLEIEPLKLELAFHKFLLKVKTDNPLMILDGTNHQGFSW